MISILIGENEKDKNERQIRILLVDDHQMMREGLKTIIEEQDDLFVVAEAKNGKEAIHQAGVSNPDIIMDVNMPHMDGIEATQIISGNNPDVRIIGLSFRDEEGVAEAIKRAGASAYLTKTEAFELLVDVIRNEARSAENSD